jgi:hypothetical protein
MGSKDPVLLLRLQAAYESGERQRTSIKRWMTDNYEDFSAKLDEMFPGQINWIWLTAWFQENGFRNRDGSDLKKDTVQKVWRRVNEERARRRPSRARQVKEIGETAMAGRNEVFRPHVSPVEKLQPVVRVEQAVSRSVPQAETVDGSGENMSADAVMAALMADINKASSRG